MSSAVLILENDDGKIINIFSKYLDYLKKKDIFIARTVAQAQRFLADDPGIVTMFVDYELDPGCGNGVEFLEWVSMTFSHFVELVVITSLSAEYSKQMCRLCSKHGIPFERLRL